jgi:hemoglobin-like flavoprotein
MTKKEIDLIRNSFAKVVPVADEAAVLFYAKLFDLDPNLRPLFKIGIQEQGRKLMQMLRAAVDGLDRFEELVPVLEDLGRRHAGYGVEDRHYDTVGKALIWTFERALGEPFTPQARDAWTNVYCLIAETMKSGAAQRSQATQASEYVGSEIL